MPKPFFNHSKRASELRDLLNKANHAYYTLDSPFIEDAVYDHLYRELLEIEALDPSLITLDSPSQRLGGKPAKGFKSVKHRIPLQSLENAFDFNELQAWHSKIQKPLDQTIRMVCELKIDGNALALSYSNGILTKATTRGNGTEGEEITTNVKTIPSIPLSLQLRNPPRWLEVRGEAYMPNKVFEKINKERKQNDQQLFANPRNACSGTLRQLDPRVVASRRLDYFAYTLHLPIDWEPSKADPKLPTGQIEALEWLKAAGFKVNPNIKFAETLKEVQDFCSNWESGRHSLPYATDGVVIKIENFEMQDTLGITQKAPKWAIALKYPAEEAPTQLTKLTFQIGRTGAVTPVAEFKPITLAGTVVSRATLHNSKRLTELGIHQGDTIIIRKAGEIIPEVVRILPELRPNKAYKLSLPTSCPECSSTLVKEVDEAITKCTNIACPAILRGSLRHWVSKNAMDIDGLGSKLIDQLVAKKLVSSIAQIYELDKKQISELDRMGEKSAEKICNAIEESKKQPWHKQLYGLGILHIGAANAKTLANTFPSALELGLTVSENPKKISTIFGIGNEIVESLQKWFATKSNQNLIQKLQMLGLSLANTEKKLSDPVNHLDSTSKKLQNEKLAITGTMSSFSRKELEEMIEHAGGKISSSISPKTTFLVMGEKPGSKYDKAKQLGVKIITEKDLIKILSEQSHA